MATWPPTAWTPARCARAAATTLDRPLRLRAKIVSLKTPLPTSKALLDFTESAVCHVVVYPSDSDEPLGAADVKASASTYGPPPLSATGTNGVATVDESDDSEHSDLARNLAVEIVKLLEKAQRCHDRGTMG